MCPTDLNFVMWDKQDLSSSKALPYHYVLIPGYRFDIIASNGMPEDKRGTYASLKYLMPPSRLDEKL